MSDPIVSWKVEVIADSSNVWCGNGLRFPSHQEARLYAIALMNRWTVVSAVRVVPSRDPVTEKEVPRG